MAMLFYQYIAALKKLLIEKNINTKCYFYTGQPLLSPQNAANIALIPPMPHMQQQHIPGAMVPVSGAPPVMVRPVDSAGNPSLPPNTGGWSL